MIGATSVVIDQMPSAVERLSEGKIEISSAWLPGIIGPDTAPCSTRKTISDGRLHAMPHRNEATVNSATDTHEGAHHPEPPHQEAGQRHADAVRHRKGGDHPGRLVGRGAEVAGDGRQRHVGDGAESSTIMKVPSASASAMNAWRPPVSGAG